MFFWLPVQKRRPVLCGAATEISTFLGKQGKVAKTAVTRLKYGLLSTVSDLEQQVWCMIVET
jgi:hypothetical protein